ncbi:MAG TPA: uroporphyrinogen decarboxylase family protein [Deltaproteobacteria bacterium]|nr:uroporphyrinogen decarboxylase family protein [Deltaproteobacteria bacterium]
MHAIERVLNALAGKPTDHVPTFCAMVEDRTFNEVLGKPLIPQELLMGNPAARFVLDRWGRALTRPVFQPEVNRGLEKRIRAQVELGFDSVWAILDETFIVIDHATMVRFNGSIFNLQPDGFGNMTYMYRGPGIKSREDFETWPYWPDADDLAHSTYRFFRKMVSRYGHRACLFGQGPAYGIQESLLWAVGFERMPVWIRREKDLVKRYIDLNEEICLKTNMALIDAGVPVVIQTDDFAFKSGPIMNPKLIDELFGPSYRRIIKAVHDRGAKYVLHSCGDNTLLFDTFVSWGVDGLHAYENTSNVDILKEKRLHGDKVTIIGGVGVDYLLTDRSRDEEVVTEVKRLIGELGPGGRFIIAPVHSLSSIPAHKLRVMVDAVARYGAYPISVS